VNYRSFGSCNIVIYNFYRCPEESIETLRKSTRLKSYQNDLSDRFNSIEVISARLTIGSKVRKFLVIVSNQATWLLANLEGQLCSSFQFELLIYLITVITIYSLCNQS